MTTAAPTTDRPLGRLEATAYAVGYMFLAIPALALFCLEATFIPLVIITVGILMLAWIVPTVAGLADVHRRMATRVFGEPILPFYKSTDGLGVLGRLQRWAGDPARWRDFIWLLVSSSIGWALDFVGVTIFLSTFWYLVFPFIFAVTPDGVFDMQVGFMTIDTQSEELTPQYTKLQS
ncbi:MAG: sensor domain-containing protein, partial [Nocardioidaceae bacterium]